MTSLLTSLSSQVDCYTRLAKLAELQHVHVQQESVEALLEVLQSRQVVLDEIAQHEQIVGPAKKQWTALLADMAPDDRAQAETLMARTRELLEQIVAADRNDVLVLQQRKISVGKQIHQASSARQVNRNYAAAAYGTQPTRMDLSQ